MVSTLDSTVFPTCVGVFLSTATGVLAVIRLPHVRGGVSTLACRPDVDRATIQVDVWAKTASSARSVAEALRDAIELDCYITAWRGESRDPETKNYRFSFDCDWIVERS